VLSGSDERYAAPRADLPHGAGNEAREGDQGQCTVDETESPAWVASCDGSVGAANECEDYPVAGSVQSRNYELTIRGNEEQRRYAVQDKAGHVVAGCPSIGELRFRYPEAAVATDVVSGALMSPQFGYVE
jgi:hypothetical protein